ncbi:MAG: hypothetical protein WC346_00025 [Methanogenium sp.]|jgi:predicted  nucleic acid-binding Zn-ribbon protein
MSESLKDDLRLDITELDRHALDQPALYAEWSKKWAEAILVRDRLKEQIAAKKAEVDDDVRSRPRDYGWDMDKNPTETWISNQVMLHTEVVELVEKMLQAQYEVNMMSVAKEAMEHRMNSLRIMTELYKGNYFSATSRSSEFHQEAVEKHNDQQREDLDKHPRMIARKMIKR